MTELDVSNRAASPRELDPQNRLGDVSRQRRGPITWFLDLFSSIWLGVWLLVFLFVYCAVGSVGIWLPGHFASLLRHDWIHEVYLVIPWTQVHLRQAPGLEMTEFEWFHWWVFNLNIALICLNLVVATIRRIPLNVINLGVWMIHTGIIILAVGSVMYFTLKLEGDTPILRRNIVVEIEGHPPVAFAAQPGAMKRVQTEEGEYVLRVMSIDPEWEILTGDDAGTRTYGVQVAIMSPHHQFVRQVLDGYPDYTEDAIWTGRADERLVRAVREIGREIVDESIHLSLEYKPERFFYLVNSRAVYLREKGQEEWVGRPIYGMPRYNERVDSFSAVWPPHEHERNPRIDPLEIVLEPKDARDPLPETSLYVTSFLPYAFVQGRHQRGGDEINPVIAVRLRGDQSEVLEYEMKAFDDESNRVEGGRLHFVWASDVTEFEALTQVEEGTLRVRVPEYDVDIVMPATPTGEDSAYTAVPGTPYFYRVESLQGPLHLGGPRPLHVAILSLREDDREFRRWVFDDESREAMDFHPDGGTGMVHDAVVDFDDAIQIEYSPRRGPAPVTIVAGPRDEDLHLMLSMAGRPVTVQPLAPRTPVRLQETISLEVLDYAARTREERRPVIVPQSQRERDAGQFQAMVRVHVPETGESVWLPYHHYAFETRADTLRRFRFDPTEITLPDGRVFEIIFSRDRRKLPAKVVLEDFQVVAHVGGFTGETSSIRDWVSRVRFDTGDGWTDLKRVSMNKPASYNGFWYFQAQWDPPDAARGPDDVPSAGLNYTVLGVGNRHGVWTQLFGCCVAVLGMIYAFYAKPVLKRRRQQAVLAQIQQRSGENGK